MRNARPAQLSRLRLGGNLDAPDSGRVILAESVKQEARRLGFRACGITTAQDLDCGPTLDQWLAEERHGHMDYLAACNRDRLRPSARLAGARSVIVVAWPYALASAPDAGWKDGLTGRIAAYAAGHDYHLHIAEKLERLRTFLAQECGADSLTHVDGGPLVEKDLARRAGIGWYGHNTNLLRPGLGSAFLLGCLITTADLAPDPPFVADHCGTCRACIPACPTGALSSGPTIDARRCISYLTIELRGPVPTDLRPQMGNWVFGCDLCQEPCPWTPQAARVSRFQQPYLPGLLAMTRRQFREIYEGTAVLRTKRRGLARNAAITLGNTANPAAIDPLARALMDDDEPLVRAHCAWSLGRLGGASAIAALERGQRAERIAPVLREIAAARAFVGDPHGT